MHNEILEEIRALIERYVPGGSTHPVTIFAVKVNDKNHRQYAMFYGGKARYLDCSVEAYSHTWVRAMSTRRSNGRWQLFQGEDALIEALRYAWDVFWKEVDNEQH